MCACIVGRHTLAFVPVSCVLVRVNDLLETADVTDCKFCGEKGVSKFSLHALPSPPLPIPCPTLLSCWAL